MSLISVAAFAGQTKIEPTMTSAIAVPNQFFHFDARLCEIEYFGGAARRTRPASAPAY